MMTYWYPGVQETIEIIRSVFPQTPIVLGGIYARLCADHAKKYAGADHVIVTDTEDMAEQTKAFTGGKGANIVFDPVAGPFLEKLAQAAAPGATEAPTGAPTGAPTVMEAPPEVPPAPSIPQPSR